MVHDVFDEKQKMDLIIIVKFGFLKNTYEENKKEIKYLYDKITRRMDK